jgi:hypothetical protein
MLSEMARYTEELVKAGALLACERLLPSSKGVRARYSDGKFMVTDGPFAETKELVAGVCLIQAKSREEAIEWARRVPFQEGEIELRPLFELTDFPVDAAEKPDGWREKEEEIRAAPPASRERSGTWPWSRPTRPRRRGCSPTKSSSPPWERSWRKG